MNPNISAGALVGFSGLFFATRPRKLAVFDYCVVGLVFLAEAVTFSRTGVLLTLIVFLLIFWMRSVRVLTLLSIVAALAILAAFFVVYIAPQLELSEGAQERLVSLMGGTATADYSAERGPLAAYALDLFYESPLSGVGVRTSLDLPEGPHNMYVALALDYGVFGLLSYSLLLLRLLWLGVVAVRQRAGSAALILPLSVWLIIYGFASHNLLSDPPILLLIAFVISAARNVETVTSPAYRTVRANLAY
jgi:O-antigen ligase